MTRGVRKHLVSSVVLIALIAVAGCSHYFVGEREPWRRDAEAACLSSGAVKESATRVRIASVDGPGMCGISYPLKVSTLGESAPLGYDDEPPLPPSSIPNSEMPRHWPVIQSTPLPPPPVTPQYNQTQYGQAPYNAPQYSQPRSDRPQYGAPSYSQPPAGSSQSGPPMSLTPPGVEERDEDDAGLTVDPTVPPIEAAPDRFQSAPSSAPAQSMPPRYTPLPQGVALGAAAPAPYGSEPAPLGPPSPPYATPQVGEGREEVIASAGPVEVKPAATLACPIVSALDQWITDAVQPAALQWFRQPVVQITQISAYSCRGMNGNPNAHISEHAFGNALDIASFTLADGHKITVQYGWHGTPEEQGFLHDVQGAACREFTTVLAPGANVYHYNHIHVDLMRRRNEHHICEPAAIPGAIAAERARQRYAAQHYGDPGVTGSITAKQHRGPLGYFSEKNDTLPLAIPGED